MRLHPLVYLVCLCALTISLPVFAQKKSNLVICSNNTTGVVVLRQARCTAKETKVSTITALRGAPGAAGPKGDTGSQGPQGVQGAQGIQGTAGTPATVCPEADVDGVCLAKVGPSQGFLAAAQACAAEGADLCSDSQSWVLRQHGVLRDLQSWTRSFADNDGTVWNEVNGGVGDDHSASTSYHGPCCRTVTPSRASDQTVNGVRVVFVYDVEDADWRTASTMCAAMKADLCDRSQYSVIRNSSVVSVRVWASDHSDNDSQRWIPSIGSMPDNPLVLTGAGFACCATRATAACPVTETNGVCMISINNTGANFSAASTDCTSQGGYICSISQSAVLRGAGILTSSVNWTGSGSDNDNNFASVGVGNAPDDPIPTAVYGYACCR